jgi:hypothetical protein
MRGASTPMRDVPYMCGLYGGTVAIAVVVINYNDVEVAAGITMRRRRS